MAVIDEYKQRISDLQAQVERLRELLREWARSGTSLRSRATGQAHP